MTGQKDEAGETRGLLPLLPFGCMPSVPKQVPQDPAATLPLLLQATKIPSEQMQSFSVTSCVC